MAGNSWDDYLKRKGNAQTQTETSKTTREETGGGSWDQYMARQSGGAKTPSPTSETEDKTNKEKLKKAAAGATLSAQDMASALFEKWKTQPVVSEPEMAVPQMSAEPARQPNLNVLPIGQTGIETHIDPHKYAPESGIQATQPELPVPEIFKNAGAAAESEATKTPDWYRRNIPGVTPDLEIASKYGIDPKEYGASPAQLSSGKNVGAGEIIASQSAQERLEQMLPAEYIGTEFDPAAVKTTRKEEQATDANYYESLKRRPDFEQYVNVGRELKADTPEMTTPGEMVGQIITNPAGVRQMYMTGHMTDEQEDVYYYLLGKYGRESAESYYRHIESDINARKGAEMYEMLNRMPAAYRRMYKTAMPVVAGMDQTISGIGAVGDLLTGDTRGRALSPTQYASQLIGEELNQASSWKIPGTDKGWKQAIYDTATTMSAQIPQMVFTGAGMGKTAWSTLYMSAFGNTYNQLRTEGVPTDQAIAMGIASAAIEGLSERIGGYAIGGDATLVRKLFGSSIDNIASPIVKALTLTGLDAGGEGFEEVLAAIAEPIAEEFILSDLNDERGFVQKLVDAWGKIDWSEVAYSGVLGMGSGGMMTGPGNLIGAVAEDRAQRDRRIREAADAAVTSIKSEETTPEQKHNAARAALKIAGVDEEKAEEIADSVVAFANGEELTEEEMEAIVDDPAALEVTVDIAKAEVAPAQQQAEEETQDVKDEENESEVQYQATELRSVQMAEAPEEVETENLEAYEMRRGAVDNVVRMGVDRARAEEIYDMTKDAPNVFSYSVEFERAYNRGRNDMPLTTKAMQSYRTLSAEQVRAAYDAGVERRNAAAKSTPKATQSATGNQGSVDTNAIKRVSLNENQRSAVQASKFIAQALGIKVVWESSTVDENGKRRGANGWYDPKDNSIHLDIYAGSNTANDSSALKYAAMRTFAHELTHMIEQQSPEMYARLRRSVFTYLGKSGQSVEMLITAKQGAGKMSRYVATQEVVADACEMMLRDSNAIKTAVKEDPSLWGKIKQRFAQFVKDLKKALEGIRATSTEANAIMKKVDGVYKYAEDLQKLWDEALLDATKGSRSQRSAEAFGEDTNASTTEATPEEEPIRKAGEKKPSTKQAKPERESNLVISAEEAEKLNAAAKGKPGVTVVGKNARAKQGPNQRAFLAALGREYGIEFVLHDTIDNGKLNGVYVSGNRVHIAQDNLEGGLMMTGIHETVHMIRAGEGEGYADLRDSVRGALGSEFNWDATVAARAEADGLDLDAAEEEVVAQAASAIYANESAMRAFVMKHSSVAKKLVEGLKNFVATMRKIADEVFGKTKHPEIAAMLTASDEAVQRVTESYERALAEYKERAKAINYEGREPAATQPKANKSTLPSWAAALMESASKNGEASVNRTRDAIAKVMEFVDKAKEDKLAWQYLSSGTANPYAPNSRSEGLGPLRTNVEYIYSFDPDTKCFRADDYIKIRDVIQRKIGRKMTARETQNLIQLMTAYGQMIPCRYCYVYGKRYMLDGAYNKKVQEELGVGGESKTFKAAESARKQIFEYLDKQYMTDASYIVDEEMQTYEFVLPVKKKTVRGKEQTVAMTPEDLINELREQFNLEDKKNLNTFLKGIVGEWLDDSFNHVSHNYDESAEHVEMDTTLLNIHATAVASAQGGVKANKEKSYAPYDHQLDKISDDDMWNIIAHDGIRFQSSTDFRIENVIDYMQLIAQMATYEKDLIVGATPIVNKNGVRTGKFVPKSGKVVHVSGLPGHMYAKSPEAAHILAPSGLHINASVAFYGDTLGKITENTAEGMPMKDVEELVRKYKNVGGMAMVTNPAQLAHAMKLVREGKLHQIIPFHASGLAREYYNDMMAWQDYTSVQSETLYTSADYAQLLKDAGITPATGAEAIIEQYERAFPAHVKLYVRNPKTGEYMRKAPHFLPGESVFEGVDPETGEVMVTTIPGHNNDYDTYMDLCEKYGVHPRFYQVEIPTEDGGTMKAIKDKVGYMALIVESRPDAPKGPVKADFDIEYALKELKARAAKQDEHAKRYLEAYESGKDKAEKIKNAKAYESHHMIDPAGIVEKFLAKDTTTSDRKTGLVGETRGLLTPDVVAMRENAGVKIDPEKSVTLTDSSSEKAILMNKAYRDMGLDADEEAREFADAEVRYSVRTEDPPKKTGIAYKVFYEKNGKLYPPMVANPGGADTPVGVWLNADIGVSAPPSKTGRLQVKAGGKGTQGGSGSLAFRPGWHLGDVPKATQFDRLNKATGQKELFPYDFVWAECEFAMDVDYQEEAMSYGYTENGKFRHSYAGLPRLPEDGYYRYRTNPNPDTVPWVITGAMKVNRILSRTEVDEILREKGVAPTKWQAKDGHQMTPEEVAEADEESIRYQARETGQLSDRELLATATEGMGRNAKERKAIYDYKVLLDDLLRKQTVAENMFRGMQKKNISREEMLTRQQQYAEILEEIDEVDRQMLEMEYDEILEGIVARERGYINQRVEKARIKAIAEYRTRRNAAEARAVMRRVITGEIKRLRNRLDNPNPEHFVNDDMRKSVEGLVKAFEPDATFSKENLADVQNAYKRMFENQAEEISATGFDERTFDNLGDLRDQLDGKRLSELSMDQLRMMRESIENILHVIQYEELVFVNGRTVKTAIQAQRVEVEARARGKYVEHYGMENIRDFLSNGNATPIYFFKNIGGTLQKMFSDFLTGEEVYANDMRDADERLHELKKKYNYDDWADKEGDKLTFTTSFGQEITLDRETALGLWATRQREMRDPENEVQHLKNGGFKYEEREWETRKNKMFDKVQLGKRRSDSETAYRLDDVDNKRIADWLTPEQRGYATEMVQYLSAEMAAKGNEVSRKLKGYSIFGEGFYYPYKSSSTYMAESLDKIESSMLKNSGFTRKLTKNASNPIVAGKFTEVWMDHVNRMSMYHAMAIPQDSFWRVYNHVTKSGKDTSYSSVKEAISNAFGKGANRYIKQLMTDIYGGVSRDYGDEKGKSLMSKFKGNAVRASLSVAIQQPSSIARATAMIPVKYFVATENGSTKQAIFEMEKYSATAFIKGMGKFDMNSGWSAVEWMDRKDLKGKSAKEKVKAFFDTKDNQVREDVFGYLPQLMDKLTWSQIWKAAKAETRAKTNLSGDDLIKATAARFDEVIRATQVYDSVLVRSQLMRSKSAYSQMITAFMAEPTLNYNMLMDAVRLANKGDKKGAIGTARAVMGSTVLNAMLKAIVSAYRDKDEEKTYIEKYIAHVVADLTGGILDTKDGPKGVIGGVLSSSLLPFNSIPLVSNVASLFQGYDVTRSDMEVWTDIADALSVMWRDDKSLSDKLYAASIPVSALTGYPISNVWRDAVGIVGLFTNSKREFADTTMRGIKYAILEELGRPSSKAQETERMASALVKGDMETYEQLYERVTEDLGMEPEEVDSAVRSNVRDRYENGEITEEEAVRMLEDHLGYEDTKDDAYAAEREVRKWDTRLQTGSNSQYARVWECISDWDGVALKAEIKELKSMGVTDSAIASSVTTHYKEEYLSATGSAKVDLRAHLITTYTMLGYSRDKAIEKIDSWEKD